MNKVVHWCYLRNLWFVWNKHLQTEIGWFTTKHEAYLCASQEELW